MQRCISLDKISHFVGLILHNLVYGTLKGYTDDIGTQAYNLQLSQRRAEAIPRLPGQAGISPTTMSAKVLGKSDPRVPGDSDQARAANRRSRSA